MKCYEEPRLTNEETDSCANKYRSYMQGVQEELTKILMNKCVTIKGFIIQLNLEKCTDTCKGETDMKCINDCGSKYMRELRSEYEQQLSKFVKEFDGIN